MREYYISFAIGRYFISGWEGIQVTFVYQGVRNAQENFVNSIDFFSKDYGKITFRTAAESGSRGKNDLEYLVSGQWTSVVDWRFEELPEYTDKWECCQALYEGRE